MTTVLPVLSPFQDPSKPESGKPDPSKADPGKATEGKDAKAKESQETQQAGSPEATKSPIVGTAIEIGGTALLIVLTALLAVCKSRLARIAKSLWGYHKPRPTATDNRWHRVLLLGQGQSGKTSLVRALSAHPSADSRASTDDVKLYEILRTCIAGTQEHRLRLEVVDYRGQAPGQLVQKWPALFGDGIKQGYPGGSTAVVFVIDAIDALEPESKSVPAPSANRCAFHDAQWPDTALGFVDALLEKQLSYCCVFVNKMDALETLGKKEIGAVRKLVSGLAGRIGKAIARTRFEVHFGSAKSGDSVTLLYNALAETAWRIHPNGTVTRD